MASQLEVFLANESRREAGNAVRENGARTATHSVVYRSFGDGELVVTQPVTFDCTFLGKPLPTSGSELLRAADPTIFLLPRGNVAVYRWVTRKAPNGKVLYTGCYIYVTVDVPTVDGTESMVAPTCSMAHSITFTGTALKALPDDLTYVAL